MNKYTTIENGQKLKMVFPFKTEKQKCEITINFHRTLRIPDDNTRYNLPPNLGSFPLEHVDGFADKLPKDWQEHGGIFLPMHQSEAMWISFSSKWPFALKIASGKVNAISGKAWTNELEQNSREEEQDYIVVPSQPWIDGFNVSKGVIRQFVAVPLNSGFTVEEQITGKAEFGGLQIMVFPLKESEVLKIEKEKEQRLKFEQRKTRSFNKESFMLCASASADYESDCETSRGLTTQSVDMGFGAGGFMNQIIYADKYGIDKWDKEGQRVFVHLLNSLEYKNVTGKNPPTKPLEPKDYQKYNYKWFDYYSDDKAISGSKELSKVNSIAQLEVINDESILKDNTSFNPKTKTVINYLGNKTVKSGKW